MVVHVWVEDQLADELTGGGVDDARLAAERKAAFCEPPTGPNQVWQFDFSEYETSRGGIWRTAGVADYWSKYEFGWHWSPTANQHDAVAGVELAIAEAARLLGASCLMLSPTRSPVRSPRWFW